MKATKVYQWYLVVEGAGSFPYDMLRYDACFPAEQIDASLIDGQRYLHKRRVVLVRRGVNENTGNGERWKSFGWNVLLATVESHEARSVADIKETRR